MDCTSRDTTRLGPTVPTRSSRTRRIPARRAPAGEARVVLRDGKVIHLLRCTACGPQEREVHANAQT
jgi:hypothetical protein